MSDLEGKQEQPTQTFGQKAVGISFNPSADSDVDRCKIQFANCIDQMDELRKKATANGSFEIQRMATLAINAAQTAQMWAVKAITWKD